MKTLAFWKKELLILAILIAPLVILIQNWTNLPELLPFHWNFNGEADQYKPKWVYLLLNTGIYLVLLFSPLLIKSKVNLISSSTYFKLRFVLILFFGAITLFVISSAMGFRINPNQFFTLSIFTLFTLLGNYITALPRNWIFGIRTPWNVRNDKNWEETHAIAGRLWFWGGLFGILISQIIPNQALIIVMISIICIICIIPLVFSYLFHQKQKKSDQ